MYPYLHIGPWTLGTFGLLLWLAAVAATYVLYHDFRRHGVDADAINVVAIVMISGVIGAKVWHELQSPHELVDAMRQIALPGWSHPGQVLMGFLHWFQAGFAWFGGLLAGILALMWQGRVAKTGPVRMLDLAAPAAAVGYGVGRIGCLTSGDGDYGITTYMPWGVHIHDNALDPPVPNPPDLLVHPTPVYELLYALAIAWWLWNRGRKPLPVGLLTGEYLVLSGIGRFLVEFLRRNPRIYWGMSNAQVAAILSVAAGAALIVVAKQKQTLPETQTLDTNAA